MRRWAELLVAGALGAALGSTTSFTLAAFSGTTASPGNSFAAAASFCNGSAQTVTASADSYVDQALLTANSNFGTATTVRVRSESLANQRTLVRFSLPAVPSYCTLTVAKLRLHASSATTGRTLQALRAAASWTETGVTWNNQPGTTGTAVTTSSATGWIEFDVKAHVDAMYVGTNNGFVVRDATEGALVAQSQVFSSREGANPPQLVLTFS